MRIARLLSNMKTKSMRGTTLVELLLYMGILTIFMATLSSLFGMSLDLQMESSATTSVDRDVSYLFGRLAYDIHRADAIVTPASTGSTATSLVLTIDGVNYTYATDSNGNITYTNNLGTFNLNSYDTTANNLTFTRIGNIGGTEDTIHISFDLTSVFTPHKGPEVRSFDTTIGLRKKL